MKVARVKASKSGRLGLPAGFRKALGLEHGGTVLLEFLNGEIRVLTIDRVVARAQKLTRRLMRGKPDASVDAFLAERRRGWA